MKKSLKKRHVIDLMKFSRSALLLAHDWTKLSKEDRGELYTDYLRYYDPVFSLLYKKELDLEDQLSKLRNNATECMIMKERKTNSDHYMYKAGQYDRGSEVVESEVPKWLVTLNKDSKIKNRLGFAKWLIDTEHPLTARVEANRLWKIIFKKPLVTGEGFGNQSDYPYHKDLLDFLASYLIEKNWSRKDFIRYLVASKVYRQTSDISEANGDLYNSFWTRSERVRLSAEVLRDQALQVSGLLKIKEGGPGVFIKQPKGLWEAMTSDASTTYKFIESPKEDQFYRSLYTFVKRNAPHPALMTLGMPNRQSSISRRGEINTPSQALVLLNEYSFRKSAEELSEKIEGADTDAKINWLYKRLFYRIANRNEKTLIRTYLHNNANNWTELCLILMNSTAFSHRK